MEKFESKGDNNEDKFEKKLLNSETAAVITELRKEKIPFCEKAKKLEEFLNRRGDCSSVSRVDCDVCIDEYLPQGETMLDIVEKSVGEKDVLTFSETEKNELTERIVGFIPEEAKTRIHAQTPDGNLTYCFDCEATMCLNQVDYSEDIDWDKEHLGFTETFIRSHPEYEAQSFRILGSTRRYICLDILSNNSELEGSIKEIPIPEGRIIKINFTSREFINLIKSHSEKEAEKILSAYRSLQ